MIGSNATVVLQRFQQARDAHGSKVDGDALETHAGVEALISRASLGNLWRITVAGNFDRIGEAPKDWKITDNFGRIFAPARATYRPPIEQIGESEHTLLFAEKLGEVDLGVEI